jgi:hypothetical protein
MTDFTDEEMHAIILRSLNENAARMRRKYKLTRVRDLPQTNGSRASRRKQRKDLSAPLAASPDRSGE